MTTLPSIPRAPLSIAEDPTSFGTDETDAPPMSELLPTKRFWLRTALAKRAATSNYRHPLFLDMQAISNPTRIARARAAAVAWHGLQAGEEVAPLPEMGPDALIFTHGGSSMGNVCSRLIDTSLHAIHHTPDGHSATSYLPRRQRTNRAQTFVRHASALQARRAVPRREDNPRSNGAVCFLRR